MKKYILILTCFAHLYLTGQNPLTCRTITEYSNRTLYSSSEFEYDNLDRKTIVKSYSDFDFKNLGATQKIEYLGNLISSNQYQYYDTLGNVVLSRNYIATPNEDCSLDINYSGSFGICTDPDINANVTIDYIDGCENGWVDLTNEICTEFDRISSWTRRSTKAGNLIKLIDTIRVDYGPNYTDVKFMHRSFLNGRLVRKYHNITDVIGNNFISYEYDEYGNVISYTSNQTYENEVLFERTILYNHTYKNSLLIETVSGNSITTYYYDDQNRLIKSVEIFSGKYSSNTTTRLYTYPNKFNENPDSSNNITLFPNPTQGIIQINPPLDQLDNVKIYTNQGVEQNQIKVDDHYIDISNLRSGIYFLSATKNGKRLVSKFIKI